MVDVAAVRFSVGDGARSAQQQNPSEEAQRPRRGESEMNLTLFVVKGQNESR